MEAATSILDRYLYDKSRRISNRLGERNRRNRRDDLSLVLDWM